MRRILLRPENEVRRRRQSKLHDWLLAVVDRAVLAIVLAVLSSIASYLAGNRQQSERVKQMTTEIQDLEWGIDYYRQ